LRVPRRLPPLKLSAAHYACELENDDVRRVFGGVLPLDAAASDAAPLRDITRRRTSAAHALDARAYADAVAHGNVHVPPPFCDGPGCLYSLESIPTYK
jgi:hypothetical protein